LGKFYELPRVGQVWSARRELGIFDESAGVGQVGIGTNDMMRYSIHFPKLLLECYENVKSAVKEDIEKANYVALTVVAWTSARALFRRDS